MKKDTPLLLKHGSIPEEEIDMNLLSSAVPWTMGFHQSTAYLMEEEAKEREYEPIVSLTAWYDIS
jgi:hypothetical protein